MSGPLRKIVSFREYHPRYTPRNCRAVVVALDCGHQTSMKGSIFYRRGVQKRARCLECRQ